MLKTKTIETEITFVAVTCGECGCTFGLLEHHYKELADSNGSFCCPNGHGRRFTGETAAQKAARLEKALQFAQEDKIFWRDEAEARAKELQYKKASLTKLKNRVAKGICPCCNRGFTNLQRHMETQHPDYLAEEKG